MHKLLLNNQCSMNRLGRAQERIRKRERDEREKNKLQFTINIIDLLKIIISYFKYFFHSTNHKIIAFFSFNVNANRINQIQQYKVIKRENNFYFLDDLNEDEYTTGNSVNPKKNRLKPFSVATSCMKTDFVAFPAFAIKNELLNVALNYLPFVDKSIKYGFHLNDIIACKGKYFFDICSRFVSFSSVHHQTFFIRFMEVNTLPENYRT